MTALDPRVRIAVDEVVLRGVPPEQAAAVVTAFEEHLRSLAATGRSALRDVADTTLHAARPHPAREPVTDPAALGRVAAESVWQSITAAGGNRA